jgi:hypothetical protein
MNEGRWQTEIYTNCDVALGNILCILPIVILHTSAVRSCCLAAACQNLLHDSIIHAPAT